MDQAFVISSNCLASTMLVTFKTVTNQVFSLNLDPSETIANVKAKIEAQEKHPVALQKVIFAGKVLTDDKTVGELGVKEKDLMVLMVSKPKAASSSSSATTAPVTTAPAAVTESATSSTTTIPAAATESLASTPPPPTSTPVTSSAPTATVPAPAGADAESFSGLATGSTLQSAKTNLMEMGYSQQEVDRAMRAAFNNPDRAAEYLMTGIPATLAAEMAPPAPPAAQTPAVGARFTATQGGTAPAAATNPPAAAAAAQQPGGYVNLFEQAAQQAQQQQPAAGGASGGLGIGTGAGLGHLRNSPQFAQMRQLIQQNPQLLQPVLQQMGTNNPQLLQLIQQNPDAFLQMLAGEGDEGEGEEASGPVGLGMPQVVHITPEEDAAINRLVALGFERAMAIEAFLACDRNEELAANYLFDQMGGDDFP
ncbi:hypothetical protein SeLEV6574_g03267 [Synchytrium endobioticum]|uniref:UV excision repair protein RAD23 n=1 Tax=Synchytrium endobioticum TaxID=286115 RepID=A0A507D4V5_9FUNG|nr:hypothetical protein SeLEV6574_g03267 [Synchytrium endobioticum]